MMLSMGATLAENYTSMVTTASDFWERLVARFPGATIETRLKSRANNFDFLRFAAAFMVIISHSFALSGRPEPSIGAFTLGTVGVQIFFVISGFLIAKSWIAHPRVSAFMGKRILRIVPGLAGVTLFSIFVIGILFSAVPAKEFIFTKDSLQYLNNIFIYTISSTLPGLFQGNALSGVVNGSLWTLPYEFTAYLLTALLGVVGIIYQRRKLVLVLCAVVILHYVLQSLHPASNLPVININLDPLFRLFAYFLCGILMYVFKDRIMLNQRLAWGALALYVLGSLTPAAYIFSLISLPYIVIYGALRPTTRLKNFGKHGDISYGMYIYAFPIQQAVVAKNHAIGPWELMLVAVPLIIIASALSWHLIEKRALRHKHVFNRDRYPILEKPKAKGLARSS
jgi:peptidoglycan/LPS O-acetylase OafA/YrhL